MNYLNLKNNNPKLNIQKKNSVVHLDTSGGDNCRFRLDHIENEWYGIKHIKVDGTDLLQMLKVESF